MTARSPQHSPSKFFTSPAQLNQRRYEALRAHFVDGLSYAEAGRRFGYTRWTMIDLARQHRAGLAGRRGLRRARTLSAPG